MSQAVEVRGVQMDAQTRCAHYHTALDVIAIKFICCGYYYPCHLCHAELADHAAQPWPVERRAEPVVLCGVCRHELSVTRYLASEQCPHCAAPFNPGCKLHSDLYFAPEPSSPGH
ncbi:CHY zinc finger protein [Glutamicibacter sp. PS]|uniref:CHY zinc finger protein n=1 Tax=Glutamicibacter sp. PS TaxID=3075634 RepID=UPI00284551CC|nr:CHY zinc finger protein [Glutamicibacter sp. PS]MDR4531947.1 CHY zinc finger protein [Glutamicibacter sp. PS]